jgi:hypothetical protein
MKRLSSILILMTFSVFFAGSAQADLTITGSVKDSHGNPVSGVTVTATCYQGHSPAQPVRAGATDASGNYLISAYFNSELFGVPVPFTGQWHVVPSYTNDSLTGAFTPSVGNLAITFGYGNNPNGLDVVNFIASTPTLKSGAICFESSCGDAIIANVCNLCPNGSKAINNNRKIYCSNGLMSTIVENVCN